MKNHPNGMQLMCVCVGGEREENEEGGVVERKEGDRFVLFFFLPTSIYDNEREEKGKKREREGEKEKERKRMLLLFSSSAKAGVRARARIRTLSVVARCETHAHTLNG